MAATVSLIHLESYDDPSRIDNALADALRPFGGMQAIVKPGSRVLLKVNLLAPAKPEEAVTTHPAIVRAVIRSCHSAGAARILVGDGPGVGTTLDNARVCGITQVCQEEGAHLVPFDAVTLFETPENAIGKHIELTSHLRDIDVLITLPKLKTHVQMGYTGALKNQYGLIPGTKKAEYHFRLQDRDRLCDLMVDINRTAKVNLAIMDAVMAMEGKGPHGGTPRHLGALIVSTDLSALDCVACRIIGLDPASYPILQAAKRGHYGTTEFSDITVVGGAIDDFAVTDFNLVKMPSNILRLLPLPVFMLKWLRRQIADTPTINRTKCIRCMKCHRGCPVKPAAINPASDSGSGVNFKTCIRCYCCHEFCPVNAIELRKSLLERLFHLRFIAQLGSKLIGRIAGWLKK